MIDLSLNEVETLSAKAARGAGFSWGLAEDIGRAARRIAVEDENWGPALQSLFENAQSFAPPDPARAARWRGGGADISDGRPLCPIRTAALLLDQGHAAEAEQVYRDDLGLSGTVQRCAQHPDNVWALHGLAECLKRRGEKEELPGLKAKLAAALAKADVPITSSCLCRTSVTSDGRSEHSCCH